MIRTILQFISDYVYLYPLFMSFVWSTGGLLFFWKQERKKQTVPEMSEYPFFSILVPCHNEEGQIEDTVSHLLELDYPGYEIILIDDGSADSTDVKIHELCVKNEKVRGVYFKENQGKAAALNAGCVAAKGEAYSLH
jgi:biofilm PGA synthesis N-glycosyltransferase PgaC